MTKVKGVSPSPTDTAPDAPESNHDYAENMRRLYRIWLKMEARAGEHTDTGWRDKFTDAQTSIMTRMESYQARTFECVLIKLLIWNSETIGAQIDAAGRADRLAHSAVRDLAALCGETELFEISQASPSAAAAAAAAATRKTAAAGT